MLSEWNMSELRFRRGRCTVDLLICKTRSEELIMINGIAQFAMLTVESSILLKRFR